jgi:hypothetical protein
MNAMCPECRKSDATVTEALDEREPCPHCGGALWEAPPRCCIPDCNQPVLRSDALPVCRDCGIKIAVAHLNGARRLHAVTAEAQRQAEQHRERVRNGQTKTACVYYLELAPNRIKIGFTSDLKQRIRNLRAPNSALLAIEPGGRDVERKRHIQFAPYRITKRLEDFIHGDQLARHITALRESYDLPEWAKVPDTRTVTRRKPGQAD